MASRRKLGLAGRSSPRPWIFCLLVFLLPLSCSAGLSYAQNSSDHNSNLQQLSDQQRWQDIVRQVELGSQRDRDTDFYYGIALAQLGRLDEAYRALLAGGRLDPKDKRFPVELGGVRFQQKRYRAAARWVRRALRIDPADSYAHDLLATIYFLQGNLQAALKYWNRIAKPQIQNIQTPAELRINSALLDRAFTFAPSSLLRLEDILTSEKRVRGLQVFPQSSFQLAAREDGEFDLTFRAQEKDGFGSNRWAALLGLFRGLFYQTVYPEYFNARGQAINITSLVRWDAQKRRLAGTYSGPLEGNPKYRYQLGFDLRNENWEVLPSGQGPGTRVATLNLRKEVFKGEISSFHSGRWDWSTGAEISHRGYRNVFAGPGLEQNGLLKGYQVKHLARLNYELLRLPERRLLLTSGVSAETASIWSTPAHTFEKIQASLRSRWFPQMSGDDYAIDGELRAGKAFPQVAFDELFMLGLERDNDLCMRAHIGTREGRKGSAPLGRKYFLSNWEFDKNVYNNGLFGLKLSPFVDTGTIQDPIPGLGSKKWLWDTGLEAKFTLLGVGFTLTYGKDLRSGNNTVYITASP